MAEPSHRPAVVRLSGRPLGQYRSILGRLRDS